MSAIAGLVQTEQPQIEKRHLDAMQSVLRIHGKDSEGLWKGSHCGLISQIQNFTPEDFYESQPLTTGPYTIVVDARLDNRDELCRKLGVSPLSSPPATDSDLILKSFLKWDKACLHHIIGAFVFAIWDTSSRTLFLARDQRGEKTVFYHKSTHGLAFATMPKGLFALPWIPRELNEIKLAEFLTLNHSNHQTSFYKDIQRLPPGHYLTFRNGTLLLKKYWELDLQQRILLKSDDEYVEQGREILETCIQSSLRSASPIGAMMSGGLDSSTVACMAAKRMASKGLRLPTFTEVPHLGPVPETDKQYGDETPYIKAIHALNPNITPHFVPGLQKGLFEGADERIAILETPHRNPFNQIWMEQICENAAAQGIKVLLTGQSGNMSLSYDGLCQLPELLKKLQWLRLARNLKELSRTTRKSSTRLLKSEVLQPLYPNWLWNLRMKRRNSLPPWSAYSAINSEFAAIINIDGRNKETGHDCSFRVPIDGRIARSIGLNATDFRGDNNQLFATQNRVELRDPLGDIRFTQWSLSIPDQQFISKGETRWLAKRIAQPILPDSVLFNRKKGLQAADWKWHFKSQISTLKSELSLAKKSPRCLRILDLKELEKILEATTNAQKSSPSIVRDKLCRGLIVARFIRSFET